MKQITKLIVFLFIALQGFLANSQEQNFALLPKPVEMKAEKGFFTLTEQTTIYTDNLNGLIQDAEVFNEYLSEYYGFSLVVSASQKHEKKSIIVRDISGEVLPDDAYRLHVTPDSILIEGKGAGVFYAFQTLKQLIPVKKNAVLKIPCVKIYDYPQFSWRGMHLDVCRHFFTPAEVKKYIDYIASYKMNVFHWHLTDDQGWRIQIDKYPKLTDVGAYRNGTLIGHYSDQPHQFDGKRYGGFYTKEQIRDIVAYAQRRHVTIVPEIEMPGHALAALAAYPEFSCTGGPFEVAQLWGVFDDVFCAKDQTILFLKDIVTEVAELFPGKYIHIGGDECPKTRWKFCQNCQNVMKREGLKDEHELQSYIIKTIEKHVNSMGKTIIGWDEILEGGLAPNAVVMSWRGTSGGIAAARQKHYVIMCPGSHCYFDHYQGNPANEPLAIGGNTTLEKVYSFNPVPTELNLQEQKYILGAQGNVWTEYIPDFKQVEYMAFPRMIALSEVLWSKKENWSYNDFFVRLKKHLAWLDMQKINYRNPEKQ